MEKQKYRVEIGQHPPHKQSLTQMTFACWRQAKKDLEPMVKECIEGFLAAGLETGHDSQIQI